MALLYLLSLHVLQCVTDIFDILLKDKKFGSGACTIGVYFNSNQIVLSDQFFNIIGINCLRTLL